MTYITTVPVLSYQDLIQLSQEHQAHITEIKNEVAAEVDNITDPQPLFDQLSHEQV